MATPVALEFRHLMAKVVIVQTNKPTEKISFPNAVASGVLHAATAELVLGTERKDIWTNKNELIVPVQPLTRLVLTVADTVLGVISKVEYVFDTAPVALEAGKTTTLDLTLHPATKIATLSGSSVTNWGSANGEGNPTQAVSNVLTLHCPSYSQADTPDSIVFTINNAHYVVASGITYANDTFTVPFVSDSLRYPYTITKIDFYSGASQTLPSCANLLGTTIYKSGASTVGINPNAIKVGNLWWATGNLVASNAVAGAHGLGGCKIGAPTDGGLYFQFGSLIGYKGGNQTNGGTGIGIPEALLSANGMFWSGALTWSWANEAMVWPSGMVGTKATWTNSSGENIRTLSDYYFNYSVAPWAMAEQNIRDFAVAIVGDAGRGTLATGRYVPKGVGDPCTYYLGGTWRLPTTTEYVALCNNQGGYNVNHTWLAVGGAWVNFPVSGGNFADARLFFPVVGYLNPSTGSFLSVITHGCYCSSSVLNITSVFDLYFSNGAVDSQDSGSRSDGSSARCVSNVVP